ncbi:bZIP transcription factor [Natrarchaeobaculum aegyptiacum]|uniref:DUF7982 domain-containing protein n=1 Tax=Natrarchaeobaculum aegyptiacum TaxID=745377 RepID=A0A2Z2HT37_9EURY|nr:bZIP transcription factor [Natrarchaeobaculum aegyptiacum]ARS89953.1 hypothetical protein B1756_09575 [Natrarchaeobaculum aegyptiacum]
MSTFEFDDQQATQPPSSEGATTPDIDDDPGAAAGGEPGRSADVDQHLALQARADLLEAENRRLRTEYARLRQSRNRTRALGLLAIAILAVAGAAVFPGVRDVLFVLAAIGAIGGVLTYYLSPGAFVAADVGERIYAALAGNLADLAGSLGLDDRRLYVPGHEESACRLFVPHHPDVDLPEDAVDGPIVTDEETRGLVLEPTGHALFETFERGLTSDLATRPGPLANQLTDALVEQFELATSAEASVEPAQVTVAISESAVGDVDRFDHPIASFLATGLAIGLEQPVDLEVTRGDGRADWLVTCRWAESDRADETATAAESNVTDGDEPQRAGVSGEKATIEESDRSVSTDSPADGQQPASDVETDVDEPTTTENEKNRGDATATDG